MTKTWVISDTHFGHAGVTKFLREDGSKLRPWDNTDEMDEALIENWNSVVNDKDRVYHLGDVVINRKALKTIGRLKGRKVLVKGNHDIFRVEEYLEYFDDIRAYVVKQVNGFNVIMSHIPIHLDSLGRFDFNIHGHLHANTVKYAGVPDPAYINVSVEQIGYTPIELHKAVPKVIKQFER